jgi:hypothetical protein
MNKQEFIITKIRQLAELYGRQFSVGAIGMMVEDLEVLTEKELELAIKTYRNNPKNMHFPLPAVLVSIIRPADVESDIPRQMGNKIWDSIAKFGHNNSESAKLYLGELGWTVVQQMGGWSSICQCASEDQRGIFVAQARDLTESVMRLSKAGKLNEKHELPKPLNIVRQEDVKSLVGRVFVKTEPENEH